MPITEKTRQEDERLREELRNADIGKFKQAFKALIPAITSGKESETALKQRAAKKQKRPISPKISR